MPAAESKRVSALCGHVAEGAFGTGGETNPGVVMAERRPAALAQINGAPDEPALADALRAFALEPAPRRACAGGGLTLLWNGPGMWLADADGSAAVELVATLRAALAATDATVTDLSHARTVIRLGGPRVRELLAKGCPFDVDALSAGDVAATQLGHFSVLLHALADEAGCDVYVFRSFALALWQWLAHAAGEFGYQIRVDAAPAE